MAKYFAKIGLDNIVEDIITGSDIDTEVIISERHGGTWKEYDKGGNVSSGRRAAYIGGTFDISKGDSGNFIDPKPYDSWTLNDTTLLWEAPVAEPTDKDFVYYVRWNEDLQRWEGPRMPNAENGEIYPTEEHYWDPATSTWQAI